MYSGPLSTLIVPGFSAPFDDAVQAADDPFGGQREVHLDPQPFSVEVVQHIQQPKSTAVAKTICHEVHRPGHIGRVWHRQNIRLSPVSAAFEA